MKIQMSMNHHCASRDGYAKFKTEIIDTGIGMSESFIPALFDSFTRETTKDTGNIMGTGLGIKNRIKYIVIGILE